MVSQDPIVTICVATHQSEDFLARTLNAIGNQTYSKIRCLISVDSSTDKTVDICESIAQEDSRFVVQVQKDRLGWIGNLNRLLKQDLGDYFMIVSHDDELLPTCIECLLTAIQSNPEASVAFSNLEEIISRTGEILSHSFDSPTGESSPVNRAKQIAIGKGLWWLPYHGLVRSAALKFDRRLRYNLAGEIQADRIWVLGLAISGDFIHVPEILWLKHRIPRSVADRWSYTLIDAAAVKLSCARFICGSQLSIFERLRLLALLPYGYARIIRWKLIRKYKK